MRTDTGTSTYVGRRIMPSRAPLRAEELTEFVGEYSSDELGTTYTVLIRDGELLAHHRRLGDIHLTQTPGRDQFWGEGSCVTFTRDARNQVTGLKWTTPPSRNVRFDRRAEPCRLTTTNVGDGVSGARTLVRSKPQTCLAFR